jgi:transposase
MDSQPEDIATLRAELALARAQLADDAATIARENLEIAKLKRQIFGARSERTARLIDQMELDLEELEAAATEDEIAAGRAAAKTTNVAPFTRKRPSRQPFPEHLPRERVVVPAPTTCNCCGGARLRKLGETITETLEVIPRRWKVIQHVREKMTCRDCERISEPPAPFHVVPRGWAGPSLLAMLLFEKFGQHPAAQSAGRALCARGRATRPVDARRAGRRWMCGAEATPGTDRGGTSGARHLSRYVPAIIEAAVAEVQKIGASPSDRRFDAERVVPLILALTAVATFSKLESDGRL